MAAKNTTPKSPKIPPAERARQALEGRLQLALGGARARAAIARSKTEAAYAEVASLERQLGLQVTPVSLDAQLPLMAVVPSTTASEEVASLKALLVEMEEERNRLKRQITAFEEAAEEAEEAVDAERARWEQKLEQDRQRLERDRLANALPDGSVVIKVTEEGGEWIARWEVEGKGEEDGSTSGDTPAEALEAMAALMAGRAEHEADLAARAAATAAAAAAAAERLPTLKVQTLSGEDRCPPGGFMPEPLAPELRMFPTTSLSAPPVPRVNDAARGRGGMGPRGRRDGS